MVVHGLAAGVSDRERGLSTVTPVPVAPVVPTAVTVAVSAAAPLPTVIWSPTSKMTASRS